MRYAPALDLRLRRSAWQRRILTGGYALAAVAWLAAGPNGLPALAGLAVLAIGLWRGRRAPWPQTLRFRPGAGWQVSRSGQRPLRAPAVRQARTGRVVTSVTLGGRPWHGVALFDDAFCNTGHKRLRSLLRHGDSGAPC